jgi:hypothetical protein
MAQLDKIRLSGTTYDIIDATAVHSLDGYYTTGETNAAITAATNALAESIAEQGYQTSGDVQNAISGKADTTAVTEAISEAVSGKLDTSIFQTYSGNTETVLASKFAGATWNSTDKKIYFYDNASATGTALAYIDGTDFVKDGFLSSVTIENKVISGESVPCLVFIWNTDAGIQETDIPLSGIFDPTNYVDVSTFTAYTAATDTVIGGKASQSDLDSLSGTVTAHTADTTIHVTSSDKTTWSGKQDALVSGTNIKTINNESVLGSGNITIDTGNKVEVSGTTLVFL